MPSRSVCTSSLQGPYRPAEQPRRRARVAVGSQLHARQAWSVLRSRGRRISRWSRPVAPQRVSLRTVAPPPPRRARSPRHRAFLSCLRWRRRGRFAGPDGPGSGGTQRHSRSHAKHPERKRLFTFVPSRQGRASASSAMPGAISREPPDLQAALTVAHRAPRMSERSTATATAARQWKGRKASSPCAPVTALSAQT